MILSAYHCIPTVDCEHGDIFNKFLSICFIIYYPFHTVRCPTGMFSKTGLEPCTLCPRGYYQPSTGKKDCLACLAPKTTHGLGTVKMAECACTIFYCFLVTLFFVCIVYLCIYCISILLSPILLKKK